MAGLNRKVAIVTGGSRGIGRAIATRLAADGASVVISYVANADKAQEVVAAIGGSGGQARAIQADIGKPADVRRLFDEAIAQFGRLDILVNNAGNGHFKPFAEVSEEEFDAVFDVNARGTFLALREATRRIADGGRIINVSTAGTVTSAPGAGVYTASKAAVEQFTLALAKELGSRGITVNTVSPGSTETEGFIAPEELKAQWIAMTPLGRLGRPEDVAAVVAMVVSEDGHWLTGQNIRAAGGQV